MTTPSHVTPASCAALSHCRALHRYLCHNALLYGYQSLKPVSWGPLELAAKDLWVELLRAVNCPIEDTLTPTLRALDRLRHLLEARHAEKPISDIKSVRVHLDAVEAFIGEVPLAPASCPLPWVMASELPTSGLLFRLLQRKPMVPVGRIPRSPMKQTRESHQSKVKTGLKARPSRPQGAPTGCLLRKAA
jgi:hypothetical protein